MSEAPRIVVVGLGYVGLPLAVALAGQSDVVGFDVDARRNVVRPSVTTARSVPLTDTASESGLNRSGLPKGPPIGCSPAVASGEITR